MANVRNGAVWQQLQRLFGLGPVAGLTDWELLGRYVERGDEAAFESLVALHGPMVLAVCRRMLDDPDDVEDAFQATFLVLVRKARSVRPREPVGHWLYGVAYRVALQARSEAVRRRSHERPSAEIEVEAPSGGEGMSHGADIGPILDHELNGLPRNYRAAVVLCYLEGRTHEEAARQLGWPVGTLKGRLARAREMLRGRLSRRGVMLSSGSLAVFLTREAAAAVPAHWVEISVKAARLAAAGETIAGVVSASAVALSEGVLRAMKINGLKLAATTFAVLLVVVAGAGAFTQQGAKPAPGPPVPAEASVPNPPVAQSKGAEVSKQQVGKPAPAPPVPAEASAPNTAFPRRKDVGAGNDKWSQAILAQLDERLTMSFPNETPLDDVLRYIKANTQSEEHGLPSGIPIYVDPAGLQEANRTMASTITMDLDGVPLRRTLYLMLRQLDLQYYVADGMLLITSTNRGYEDLLEVNPVPDETTPLMTLKARAERGELSATERQEFLQMLKDLNEIQKEFHELKSPRSAHGVAPLKPAASPHGAPVRATPAKPNPPSPGAVPR